jgi:hypothetical protein
MTSSKVPLDFGPPIDPELYIPQALCDEIHDCTDGLYRMVTDNSELLIRAVRARKAVYDLVNEEGMADLNEGDWMTHCNKAAGIANLEHLASILVDVAGRMLDPYRESDLWQAAAAARL